MCFKNEMLATEKSSICFLHDRARHLDVQMRVAKHVLIEKVRNDAIANKDLALHLACAVHDEGCTKCLGIELGLGELIPQTALAVRGSHDLI